MQLQKNTTIGHTPAVHLTLALAVDSNFISTHLQHQHGSAPLWGPGRSCNGTGQLHLSKHSKAMGMLVYVNNTMGLDTN